MKNARNSYFLRNVKAIANAPIYKRVAEIFNDPNIADAEAEACAFLASAGIVNTEFFTKGHGRNPDAIRNTYLLFG